MKRNQSEINGSSGKSNKNSRVQCSVCLKNMRSDNLGRHMATHNKMKTCHYCKKEVREDKLPKHEILCRDKIDESHCNRTSGIHQHTENDLDCSSVSGYFNTYTLSVNNSPDYDDILNQTCAATEEKLYAYLSKHPIKAQIIVTLLFFKNNVNGDREESEKSFRSNCEPLLIGDDVNQYLVRCKEIIRLEIDTYERHGSGWIYDKLCSAKLEIARYNPLSGSGSVEIPKKLKNIRSVLDIKSGDNKCFLYCLLAKLYPYNGNQRNANRYTNYLPYTDKINMGEAKFPVKLSDIAKIEKLNNLSISVFQWWQETETKECIIPLRHGCGNGIEIDLLYIEDNETAHYLLIKNFNSFM